MEKDVTELIPEIDELIKAHWDYQDDPESLSKALQRLEVKISMLSPHVAQAEYDLNLAKTEYEYDWNKLKLDKMREGQDGKKLSATAAESLATEELIEQKKALHTLEHAYRLLKLKREDTQRVVDAARSRLSLIKNDMRNA